MWKRGVLNKIEALWVPLGLKMCFKDRVGIGLPPFEQRFMVFLSSCLS